VAHAKRHGNPRGGSQGFTSKNCMQIECGLIAQTHQIGFRLGHRVFCSLKKRQPPAGTFKSFLHATSNPIALMSIFIARYVLKLPVLRCSYWVRQMPPRS
jgi:hypothetical protein